MNKSNRSVLWVAIIIIVGFCGFFIGRNTIKTNPVINISKDTIPPNKNLTKQDYDNFYSSDSLTKKMNIDPVLANTFSLPISPDDAKLEHFTYLNSSKRIVSSNGTDIIRSYFVEKDDVWELYRVMGAGLRISYAIKNGDINLILCATNDKFVNIPCANGKYVNTLDPCPTNCKKLNDAYDLNYKNNGVYSWRAPKLPETIGKYNWNLENDTKGTLTSVDH